MNRFLLPFLIALSLGACKKLPVPNTEYVDTNMYERFAVTSADFVSNSGNNLYFDLNVVAVKNSFTDFEFPDTTFVPYNQNGLVISVESVEKSNFSNNDSYQTIVLLDQTDVDFKFYDGPNIVSSLNRLNKLSKPENGQYFGVGFFARDEYSGNSPINYFKNINNQSLYEHTEQEMMEFITQNYLNLGKATQSNLYDALNNSVDKLIETDLSTNKSVTVVYTNLDDGASSVTYTQIIQKCLANNIKINSIYTGNINYIQYRIAMETGGFIAHTGTISTPLYYVHDLLANNKKEYTLKCKATKASNWGSISYFQAYISAFYEQGVSIFSDEFLRNEVDQVLPIYFKIP
jgi:hypothetical protein